MPHRHHLLAPMAQRVLAKQLQSPLAGLRFLWCPSLGTFRAVRESTPISNQIPRRRHWSQSLHPSRPAKPISLWASDAFDLGHRWWLVLATWSDDGFSTLGCWLLLLSHLSSLPCVLAMPQAGLSRLSAQSSCCQCLRNGPLHPLQSGPPSMPAGNAPTVRLVDTSPDNSQMSARSESVAPPLAPPVMPSSASASRSLDTSLTRS